MIRMIRILALSFLILNWCATAFPFRVTKLATDRCPRLLMAAAADNEVPGNAVPMDSPEVKFVLGELMKTLEKSAKMTSTGASDANAIDTDVMMVDVDAGFAKILSEIKSSSKLTERQKRLLAAETALTMSDAIQGDGNAVDSANPANNERIGDNLAKTLVYAQAASPYLIVHGPGAVGRGVCAFMRNLASANNNSNKVVKVKYLEAASLATVPDSELEYVLCVSAVCSIYVLPFLSCAACCSFSITVRLCSLTRHITGLTIILSPSITNQSINQSINQSTHYLTGTPCASARASLSPLTLSLIALIRVLPLPLQSRKGG
jgi:hypothetical protein